MSLLSFKLVALGAKYFGLHLASRRISPISKNIRPKIFHGITKRIERPTLRHLYRRLIFRIARNTGEERRGEGEGFNVFFFFFSYAVSKRDCAPFSFIFTAWEFVTSMNSYQFLLCTLTPI